MKRVSRWASLLGSVAMLVACDGDGSVPADLGEARDVGAIDGAIEDAGAVHDSGVESDGPSAPGGAPEPAASAIVWEDDFGATSLGRYAKAGTQQIISDGHDGSAVRFPYTSSSYDNLVEFTFPEQHDVYFRYWFRLSAGADPTCGGQNPSGMKWFMPWRDYQVAPRYTMGVGRLDSGGPGSPSMGIEFTSHDNASGQQPNPFLQNISTAKRFDTVNDGQWHKYTLHVVITPDGHGYEQIWVDDLLVLDDSAYNYDHDPHGIVMVQFPGTVVQFFPGCDFTIDVDDLVVWHG